MNLSGWKFVDGIILNEGTILAAGKHLVVAANAEWMKSTVGYSVLGNFSALDSGELLRIEDNLGNLVDEVYYYPSEIGLKRLMGW